MEPLGSEGLPITGYRYHAPSGAQLTYSTQDIFRPWTPDPASVWHGVGALGPQALSHDTLSFTDQTARSHFQNDATPKIAITTTNTDAQPMDAAETAAMYRDWSRKNNRRHGEYAGVPVVLPPHFALQELQGGMADLSNLASYQESQRDQVLKAAGVPPSILGQVVDVNRAAAETNQYVFDVHTIEPMADLVADAMTHQLAHDMDPMLVVQFEEFIAKDQDAELRRIESELSTKRRSINQVLEAQGMEPVEWGDLPVGAMADTPYTGDTFDEPVLDEDPAALDEPDDQAVAEPTQAPDAGFDEAAAITPTAVLNGAQVASIVDVVSNVGSGTLGKDSAVALLGVAFGIEPAVAAEIVGDPQPPQVPPQFGSNPPPQAEDDDSEGENDDDRAATSATVDDGLGRAGRLPAMEGYQPASAPQAEIHGHRVAVIAAVPDMRMSVKASKKLILATERKWQKRFAAEWQRIVTLQKKWAMASLRDHFPDRMRAPDTVPGLIDGTWVFDESVWDDEYGRRLVEYRTGVVTDGWSDTAKHLLGDAEKTSAYVAKNLISDSVAERIRSDALLSTQRYSATLRKRVGKALAEAFDDQVGLPEIEKRLNVVFRGQRAHVPTIARTEVGAAYSRGQLESFREGGVDKKQWVDFGDSDVRHDHNTSNMHASLVQVSEPFVLGNGEQAAAPRIGWAGSQLSAGQAVNCRCITVPAD